MPNILPSERKTKKLKVKVGNKWVHFGAKGMSDFTIHGDEDRRIRYLKRHWNIFNKDGDRVIMDRNSPSYWSARILWDFVPSRDIPLLT